MEKIIIYLPEVQVYFNSLMDILFEKEYFGFVESAEDYVWKIRDFIEQKIAIYPTKNIPAKLLQYGEKYLTYKANQQTTWYIFFHKQNNIIL